MNASVFPLRPRIAVALAVAGLCGACSTMQTMIPGVADSRTQSGVESHQGPVTPADKIVVLPMAPSDLDCPPVEIADGGATARVGGPDSKSVRYQFDISNTARECDPQGKQFALKIGVSGLLLIGPAGSPGTYATTLRVAVKDEAAKKNVFEKSFKIEANTSGGVQAPFQLVTDPILLPLTRTDLDNFYSIEVGFGSGSGAVREHVRHKTRAKAEKPAGAANPD
jgi:hypothetical protein